jgi:selenium-binding protein 1
VQKVIEIPAEPADPDLLPPLLKGFKAVPPLVTDINLSLDDKWLYVSCWGTGELRRYDVSVPEQPKLTSTIQIGGIVRRAAHPKDPATALNGGPQMVEISRDGKRVYFMNSLYAARGTVAIQGWGGCLPWRSACFSGGGSSALPSLFQQNRLLIPKS